MEDTMIFKDDAVAKISWIKEKGIEVILAKEDARVFSEEDIKEIIGALRACVIANMVHNMLLPINPDISSVRTIAAIMNSLVGEDVDE